MITSLKTLSKLRQKQISVIVRSIAECIVTVVLMSLAQNFFKLYGPPRKRGFFCDDESLKYPYHEDTVHPHTLLTLTLYVPAVIVIMGECLLFFKLRKQSFSEQRRDFVQLLFRLHHNIVPYYCCFAMHAFFIHLAKVSLGSLRPHFFQVCQPYRPKDGSTCNDPHNQGIYIEDYKCGSSNDLTVSKEMLFSIHISFPSGHASYICYSMVYLIFYLQRFSKELREHRINVGLLMVVLQMSCALLAWFIAVSRVMDYKHHWSDVLVGILLGSSVAIAVSLYVRQQLNSVNILPQGVKTSNLDLKTTITTASSTTALFTTTMPNTILVPQ